MNPHDNLKSEEKLDSLSSREGKSRLRRRKPLIKSYRLVPRFSLRPSEIQRTANFRREEAADFPLLLFSSSPLHLYLYFLHCCSIGASLTTLGDLVVLFHARY